MTHSLQLSNLLAVDILRLAATNVRHSLVDKVGNLDSISLRP